MVRSPAFTARLCLLLLVALSPGLRAEPLPVVPGSALDRLILENQAPRSRADSSDQILVPLWLRAHWRKAHPGTAAPGDPTGGYPHALKEVHEWMLSHQDLQPGIPEPEVLPGEASLGVGGTNLRISGAQTRARSESDIRVAPWDPRRIVAGSNNIGGSGQQAQLYSADGGATWGQSYLPLVGGDGFHADPSVDWTSDGTAWATTLGINASGTRMRLQTYRSADGGATWTWDATVSGNQTRADKPRMWVDHGAASPFKDHVYVCWHNGYPQFVSRRTAAGWDPPQQLSGAETSGTALGCDVKTNGAGDVFVLWPATGNRRLLIAKSTDGGARFGTPVILATTHDSYDIGLPAFYDRRALIYVTAGAWRTAARNMVYASWTDLSGEPGCTSAADEPDGNVASSCTARIWFARSSDGGTTWSAPIRLHHQSTKNDQFNPWLVVDETNGQLAIVYYDTVEDPGRRKTHLYYQASFDHGATWTAPFRVTTAPTDETDDRSNLNQYGDYNGLSGYAGSFWPSWTDRRGEAVEEIWTANVQENGIARATDLYLLPPCRAIDTRRPTGQLGGPALPAGTGRLFALTGACGIPATARALAVNLTVTGGAAAGELQIGDTGVIAFSAGQTRSNNAIVPLALDGSGRLEVRAATGQPIHFILDVVGWFQ